MKMLKFSSMARVRIPIFIVTCSFISFTSYCQQSFIYKRDFKFILEQTKDRTDPLFYDSLLVRFHKNDPSLTKHQTLALLIGYTDNNFYDPYNDMETEKEIYDINEGGDYETGLQQSLDYLEKHPLSLRILKEASYSYNQLRKWDSAKFYMSLVDKVMSAMIYSGKGKTPESAIFSLALNDGEHFIPNVGMTIVHKSTATSKDKLFMEVIKARTDEGADLTFYFVIEHAKQKMDQGFIKERPIKKSAKNKKTDTKKLKKAKSSER